jgi:hypothetical protein
MINLNPFYQHTCSKHFLKVIRVGGDKLNEAPIWPSALGSLWKTFPSHHNVSEQGLLPNFNFLVHKKKASSQI